MTGRDPRLPTRGEFQMLSVGVVGLFLSGLMFCLEGARSLGASRVLAEAATRPLQVAAPAAQARPLLDGQALVGEDASAALEAAATLTPVASAEAKLASALSLPAELASQDVALLAASAPRATPLAETAFLAAAPAPRPAPGISSSAHRLITRDGEALPCTDCDVGFAEGIYRLIDLRAAARVLGLDPEDLSNLLWAGGTLHDVVKELGADLSLVRDAVDAERYRALVNSDYLRDQRPELCCSGPDCPDVCSSGCADQCGGMQIPSGGWGDPSSGLIGSPISDPACLPYYRVTAARGLHLRRGPGTDYEAVRVAGLGTVLPTTGEMRWSGDYQWLEVIHGGEYLWAATTYLEPLSGGCEPALY